jgi:o-succinylbenzoate---CoA ligase
LVRALTLGWHIDIVEPISNPLKELKKEYDFSAMVPMQLKNSLSDIHKIKKLIIGGGVVTQELEMQLQSISTEVYATFGMTETCTHIAVKKLNQFTNIDSNTSEKLHYKVLPNVSISQDHRNCLVINASKIAENQIVTNDIVEIVSETEFKWLGRFDTVINSGGVKLHPEEIEKKLSKIITQRFFVAGVPDKVLGEKLILVIEENITSKAVEEFLKIQLMSDFRKIKNITNYEIPKEIHFVENFIETETKKIQRVKMLDTLLKTN